MSLLTSRTVQLDISHVFRNLGYRSVSTPPQVVENQLNTASCIIVFSHEQAESFTVSWESAYGLSKSSIMPYTQRTDEINTGQHIAVHTISDELDPVSAVPTSEMKELERSNSIVLKGTGTTHIEAWVSMSREAFIGRSRFVLSIHGKVSEPESDRKEKAGLIPRLFGRRLRFKNCSLEEYG